MNQRGLYHWNTNYPNVEQIKNDIRAQKLYIKKTDGYTMAMFALDTEYAAEYQELTWAGSNDKALIIHKFCIHPKWQNSGVETQIIEYIEAFARKEGYQSIRLDIAGNDEYGMNVFKKASFQSQGDFLLPYQKMPFNGLEKEL